MIRLRGVLAAVTLALFATSAAAQDRGLTFHVLGGGYSHTRNLSTSGPEAHFKAGYMMAAGLGYQFNKFLIVQGDFTFARTKGLGDVNFAGELVNRFYLAGRVDLRYPLTGGFVPYVFGGGGRVHVDQQGIESQEDFEHFHKFAGIFGAGLTYEIPRTHAMLMAEGKALTYKWVAAPYNRNQLDLTYSLGFGYRFGF